MIVLAVSIAVNTMAQKQMDASNSTNSDRRNIIVTLLATNDTNTSDAPALSISSEDFWAVFSSFLEPSINGSNNVSQ